MTPSTICSKPRQTIKLSCICAIPLLINCLHQRKSGVEAREKQQVIMKVHHRFIITKPLLYTPQPSRTS